MKFDSETLRVTKLAGAKPHGHAKSMTGQKGDGRGPRRPEVWRFRLGNAMKNSHNEERGKGAERASAEARPTTRTPKGVRQDALRQGSDPSAKPLTGRAVGTPIWLRGYTS